MFPVNFIIREILFWKSSSKKYLTKGDILLQYLSYSIVSCFKEDMATNNLFVFGLSNTVGKVFFLDLFFFNPYLSTFTLSLLSSLARSLLSSPLFPFLSLHRSVLVFLFLSIFIHVFDSYLGNKWFCHRSRNSIN